MSKIDISKIKPGDQVQVANGDWYEVKFIEACPVMRHTTGVHVVGIYGSVPKALITDHKPAAAPEPVWVTAAMLRHALRDDVNYDCMDSSDLESIACEINGMVKHEYGPPPVIKTATGEQDARLVLYETPLGWGTHYLCDIDPGDRYVELPKCCGEGEA